MSATKPTRRQQAWRESERLKQIGRAAITKFNAERQRAPICGAHAKRTGEPCQAPAMDNGRCRIHGGLTPKGDKWHELRWPSRGVTREQEKVARKIQEIEKRRKARVKRLAAMTPEQRARHELWQRRHKPGSAAARKRACDDIRHAREMRDRLDRYAEADTQKEADLEPGSARWLARAIAAIQVGQEESDSGP